jgi:phosphoglycerol transferase MdoB-like AlkP superfamily enzyme
MSENSTSASSGGVGLFGLLGVAFIVLKLTKVISWSWLWVLAPFWAPIVFVILAFVVGFIIFLANMNRGD